MPSLGLPQREARRALTGFFDAAGDQRAARAFQLLRPNYLHQILRHVLCRRVEWQPYDGFLHQPCIRESDIAGHHFMNPKHYRMILPSQKLMIPLLLQPHAQLRLDDGEVEHAADIVKALRSLDHKMHPVVMPVEVTALRLMPCDTMPAGNVMVAFGGDHLNILCW